MTDTKSQGGERSQREIIEVARKHEMAFRKTETGKALVKFENATASAWIADCREGISDKRLEAVWETQYAAREEIVFTIQALQERCAELEEHLERYQAAAAPKVSRLTADRIAALEGALKAADRALHVHVFEPRGHDKTADRDTCRKCGHNFRHEHHLRAKEGHTSDVKAEASRQARQALSQQAEGEKAEPEGGWQPGIECEHGYDACPICDKPRPDQAPEECPHGCEGGRVEDRIYKGHGDFDIEEYPCPIHGTPPKDTSGDGQ